MPGGQPFVHPSPDQFAAVPARLPESVRDTTRVAVSGFNAEPHLDNGVLGYLEEVGRSARDPIEK